MSSPSSCRVLRDITFCCTPSSVTKSATRCIAADVLNVLQDGVFASEDSIADHIYDAAAPHEVQSFTKRLQNDRGVDRVLLFAWARFYPWIEEVLCDLVGLLTFGPSFIAATCDLLSATFPSGAEFGRDHPPPGWRINTLLRCATILGLDALPPPAHPRFADLQRFWERMKARRRTASWYDVFTDAQLNGAVTGIQELLSGLPPASYRVASYDLLDHLLGQLERDVPPTGFALDARGRPTSQSVDFRHIIFAGWINCQGRKDDEFERVQPAKMNVVLPAILIDAVQMLV